MKINTKLVLIFLEIALIPLIIMQFVAYSSAKDQIDLQITSKLEAVADIQKGRFELANKNNLQQLLLITGDINLRQQTDSYIKTQNMTSLAAIQNILDEETNGVSDFRDSSVADLNGTIIASTDSKLKGSNISKYEYFQKAKNINNVTDFFKNPDGSVSLISAGPLILDGKTVGVYIANTDGSDIVSSVTNYSGFGTTGETLLVTKDSNGNVLFLTPTRFDPNAALARIITKDKTNIPSVHAANGEEITMLNAVDYNGTPVIAVTRYIPDVKWGIVAKISQSEAYAAIQKIRGLFVFMIAVSVAIVVLISYSVAKSFTDPIQKLTSFAVKVGQGDLSQRVDVKSKDETGKLADIFNETVSKLQSSYENLEKKIAERTSDLTTNIQELQDARRASQNILEDVNIEKTKFEAILKSIGEGLIAVGNDRKVLFFNKIAAEMLGFKENELIGQTITELPLEDEGGNLLPLEKRPTYLALHKDSVYKDTYFYVRKDKTRFPIMITATPIKTNGKTTGLIEILRDITHEKEVDRMKTEFVSLSSHQLRTPLTAVKWGLETVLNGDIGVLNEKQKEYLKDAADSNQREIELVNSLLNVSRIESGRILVNPHPTNIVRLANNVVSRLKIELAKKDISLVMNVEGNPPELLLDTKLIENVYQNIIDNSVNYSPAGSKIILSISVKDGEIISSIADEGIGIPENEKVEIFKKFYRSSNAKQIRPDGSGLGLYIAKSIVESSGGKIWLESSVGHGTTFFFTLPLTGMKAKEGEVTLT